MELDRRGAELLFQVLTEGERSAVAIASNEPFSGWTKTFCRPTTVRRDRRPADLRRTDHRDRHHQLSARPRPSPPRHRLSQPPRGSTGRVVTLRKVMVTDLPHFLDLPPDTPCPARRLAAHLGTIVRAATSGDAGTA